MASIHSYHIAMKRTGVAELKNRLSYYLRFVRRGQSVLICDRDVPIARIDPIRVATAAGDDDLIEELQRTGSLRAPSQRLAPDWRKERPGTRADVVAAIIKEREEGR